MATRFFLHRVKENRSKTSFSIYIILSLVLFLGFFQEAECYGYNDALGNGSILPGIHPRSLSIGGARSIGSGDAGSIFLNPSELLRAPSSRITVSGSMGLWKEQVETQTIRTSVSDLDLGTAMAAFKAEISRGIAIGAGIARISDHSFTDQRYIYSSPPDSSLIAIEHFNSSGGLWEAVAGVGFSATSWLNLGLSAGTRFGNVDFTFEHVNYEGEDDSTATWGWKEDEFCWHAGATVPFGLNSIGISYVSGTDHFNSRVAAGFLLYTGTMNRGAIGGEVELCDTKGDGSLVTVRIFGQYSPENNLVFNGGVRLTEESVNELTRLGMSLGGAYSFNHFQIDGAISYCSAGCMGESFSHTDPDDINNAFTLICFGLSYIL